MTTVNTSAIYSPSQIGFKGKEKRVIPTIVKDLLEENRSKRIIQEELINDPSKPIKEVPTIVKKLLEENKGQQVISEELQVDLHRPISERVSDLTKKANKFNISV